MPLPRPLIPHLLGWGGVIPFVGSALAKAFGDPLMAIYALNFGTVYGAVIIGFLGAIHWGAALTSRQNWRYIWSVLPALAMVPVLVMGPVQRVPFLVAGLVICWGVDLATARKGGFAPWYMRLRHGLTAVAVAALISLVAI
ncbi:MAG: DUF3429 domain-containing protein [Alphaproteobacteria bacterium]|nr:DUF3429 domain-containing protein [Alphaproteobacteria bacterium]